MNPLLIGLPLLAGAGVIACAVFRPASAIFCPTITRLDAATDQVALTFDDGPRPGSTDIILDILASRAVPANFFVIGRHAAAHPELLRRMTREGHLVGNHTFDHHRLGLLRGSHYWRRQVASTSDLIEDLTGARPRHFRAPMGFKAPSLAAAARAEHLAVVAWSRRTFDGAPVPPRRLVEVARAARPGDILLLHDGSDRQKDRQPPAAIALPEILDVLAARGLRPVRLDQPAA